MKGDIEVSPKAFQPRGLYIGDGAHDNRDARFGYVGYKKAPEMFSQVIDYSTRRGVLPCYGITRHVLRNPPSYSNAHSYHVVGGMSRSQNNSLANARRPLDLPVQKHRSNINGALPITLPIPSKRAIRAV